MERDSGAILNRTNSSSNLTEAANVTASATLTAASSVSFLYQYFAFMSYFMGKNTELNLYESHLLSFGTLYCSEISI